MKTSKFGITLLALGAALIALSFAVPLVALLAAPAQGTGIIGGAGAPTFGLLYTQMHAYVATTVGCILAAVGLARR